MNQREEARLNVSDMTAHISDKSGFSTGIIKNISRFGICIDTIPRKLQPENDCITVSISQKKNQLKLVVKPVWMKHDGSMTTTGAVINRTPWEWTAMILQLGDKPTGTR